jgi:hypothetical protein
MSILSSFIKEGNVRFWTKLHLLVLVILTSKTETFNGNNDIKLFDK